MMSENDVKVLKNFFGKILKDSEHKEKEMFTSTVYEVLTIILNEQEDES